MVGEAPYGNSRLRPYHLTIMCRMEAQLNKNALLILDGFDEYFNNKDLLQSEAEFSSYTQALYELLNPHNEKLPFTRLVTSRPASCSTLFKLLEAEQCTKLRLFELTGFNMTNIKKYVIHYFQQTSPDEENANNLNQLTTKCKR